MMYAAPITSRSPDLAKIETLYTEAFPENERSPFNLLLDDSTNCSEVFAFYEGEMFCGFMSLLTFGDISHIIYFSMSQLLRNRGFGGEALQLLRQIKPEYRLLADIEVITTAAENNLQRDKRKQFYLKNGYVSSGVTYAWRNESYEILVSGGDLSEQEFCDFWESVENINVEFSRF